MKKSGGGKDEKWARRPLPCRPLEIGWLTDFQKNPDIFSQSLSKGEKKGKPFIKIFGFVYRLQNNPCHFSPSMPNRREKKADLLFGFVYRPINKSLTFSPRLPKREKTCLQMAKIEDIGGVVYKPINNPNPNLANREKTCLQIAKIEDVVYR